MAQRTRSEGRVAACKVDGVFIQSFYMQREDKLEQAEFSFCIQRTMVGLL